MLGSKKSPLKDAKPRSKHNPFDSDEEKKDNRKNISSKKNSSEYNLVQRETNTNPFDDVDARGHSSSSSYARSYRNRNMYKNDFRDSGGLQSQSVEDLEEYAVYKAEETTKSVNNCRKIAEEMREDATKTLVMLHHQGEQITRSHDIAAGIDHNLSRGEKLLGSLGGMFSKTWKPKKTGTITGPTIFGDDPVRKSANHLEQREKLGLNSAPKGQSKPRKALSEPTNAFERVEVEKEKQDDALSDISDLLGELKGMAIDMGTKIEKKRMSRREKRKDIPMTDPRREKRKDVPMTDVTHVQEANWELYKKQTEAEAILYEKKAEAEAQKALADATFYARKQEAEAQLYAKKRGRGDCDTWECSRSVYCDTWECSRSVYCNV